MDQKIISKPLAPLLPVRLVSNDPVLSPTTTNIPRTVDETEVSGVEVKIANAEAEENNVEESVQLSSSDVLETKTDAIESNSEELASEEH